MSFACWFLIACLDVNIADLEKVEAAPCPYGKFAYSAHCLTIRRIDDHCCKKIFTSVLIQLVKNRSVVEIFMFLSKTPKKRFSRNAGTMTSSNLLTSGYHINIIAEATSTGNHE